MKKNIYLFVAIAAAIITAIPLTIFILQGDYGITAINEALFSNYLVIFLLFDLLFSCLAFWVFMYFETKKHAIKYWWIAFAMNFLVGLCVAIPVFFYIRERQLELNEKNS